MALRPKLSKEEREIELRGYLMGLEDGYCQAIENITTEPTPEGIEQLCNEAQKFADEKGEQSYSDFVEEVKFHADGRRSRGWLHSARVN